MSRASSSEREPLLAKGIDQASTGFFSPIRRVLFVALVSAASFAFTQTSLIYAFRVMTCEDYYDHLSSHNDNSQQLEDGHYMRAGGVKDRCSIPTIEGRTARAIAIMSTMTTFCCTFRSSSYIHHYSSVLQASYRPASMFVVKDQAD